MGKTASHVTPAPHICHLLRILNRPVGHGLLPTAEKGLHRAQGPGPGPLCHAAPSRYFGVGLSESHARGGRYASGRGKGDRSGTTTDAPRRVWVFPCDMPPIPFEHRPVWATRSRTRRWAPPSRKEPIDHTSALCDRSSTRGASAHAVRRAQPRLRAERRWVRMQRNSSSP